MNSRIGKTDTALQVTITAATALSTARSLYSNQLLQTDPPTFHGDLVLPWS